MSEIRVKLSKPNAKIPTRSDGDAGYDLYAVESGTVKPYQRLLVPIGIEVAIPKGNVGLIWPRSKLATKQGIAVGAGVVDSSYRGEVHVLLMNTTAQPFHFEAGDRIAQMVVQQHSEAPIIQVSALEATERGEEGILSEEERR